MTYYETFMAYQIDLASAQEAKATNFATQRQKEYLEKQNKFNSI